MKKVFLKSSDTVHLSQVNKNAKSQADLWLLAIKGFMVSNPCKLLRTFVLILQASKEQHDDMYKYYYFFFMCHVHTSALSCCCLTVQKAPLYTGDAVQRVITK